MFLVLLFFLKLAVLCTSEVTSSRYGSCPPNLSVSVCEPSCTSDSACSSLEICCPTACGGSMCVPPMTKRNFVDLVKEGECPQYHRGPWICSNTCSSDSDCPRALKCCVNRCGAKICTRPEIEENTID